MELQEKQETTTGKLPEKTPILASESASMAASLKPAPVKNESGSTEIASILALLQSDFSDLQSKGLKVSILAKENRLYASIAFDGHELAVSDTGKKAILLDGKPVAEYE
jgi:hypothetical protein